MLRTAALAVMAGMVIVLSSFAQTQTCSDQLPPPQKTNPPEKSDLRSLLLTTPELQNTEGLGLAWQEVSIGLIDGQGFFAGYSHLFSKDNERIEIRLFSFDKDDNASAEEKAKNFIIARLKDAEAEKAILDTDPRKPDADKSKLALDLNKDAKECYCQARDVALIRATVPARDGFANGIKLFFRLRGIVVNVEMTNRLTQGTPASPDSRDGTLLNVAKTQRNKACNSPFIKPKT